jgi:GT2 family glycosyltransferase
MTLWKILVRVAPLRPAQSMAALWWQLTRRRVRAKNVLKAAAADLPFFYRMWMKDVEPKRLKDLAPTGIRLDLTVLVLPGPNGLEGLERSLKSIRDQAVPATRLLAPSQAAGVLEGHRDGRLLETSTASEAGMLVAALEEAGDGFLVPLRAGDELAPWALACLNEGLCRQPTALIAYGDHDHLTQECVRFKPWFKPEWDEELFLASDYVSCACAIHIPAARAATATERAPESLFELLLALAHRNVDGVVHIPHILVHAALNSGVTPPQLRAEAIERQLAVPGLKAKEGPYGSVQVQWPLREDPPLATIIIPTRDKLELLETCVRSVLAKTDYPRYEILIVDNASSETKTLNYLHEIQADARVRVLSAPIPYNYSALNNLAVAKSRGDFVCLLNNDTEVVEAGWLTELMRHAARPDVGAVGAKLLYEDGTIQHAGVVVGLGDAAGHLHRNVPNDQPGYFAQPHLTRSVTAVTGACLLVSKDKYLAVGGLDEKDLAVAYNDIDLCLKLRRAGWRNVYVPFAVLIHHESRSRAKDHAPSQIHRYTRELQTFQERWGIHDFLDPFFSPNLDPESERVVVRLT